MFESIIASIVGFFAQGAQTLGHATDGTVHAVDLTDPLGFTVYVGMAFVLYAIRETEVVPNKFLPIVAIILGLSYSTFVEYHEFSEGAVIAGLRLALLGIGSVATIKYFMDGNGFPKNGNGTPTETNRVKE